MKLILKGFIIGIGKIMPGVSGAMIAITLNEYDKIIECIATLKTGTYKKIKYLTKIGIGIIIAVIFASKIIVKLINKHYLATILLFEGIIISEIPNIIKKIKHNKKDILTSIIISLMIIILLNLRINKPLNMYDSGLKEFIKLITIGIIDALSSIIPGISGTAILMYLGYYNKIITMFSTITVPDLIIKNLLIAVPFFLGFVIGIILISKIINIIIKKKENVLNITVTIFMIYTCTSLAKDAFKQVTSTKEIIIGITFFVISIISITGISNKKRKKYIYLNEVISE